MPARKPLVIDGNARKSQLPAGDDLAIGNAAISAISVMTAQTFSLPATGGTLALTTDIAGGTRFIDGGNASSVYTAEQILDGGNSSNL